MGGRAVCRFIGAFLRDQRGVTVIEYGMMLAIFSLVVTTALSTVGSDLASVFTRVNNFLQ